MEHTKGPWNANYTKFDGDHVGFHITCNKFGSLHPICETNSNTGLAFSSSEIEANAALIARAPEMAEEIEQLKQHRDELLEALQLVLPWVVTQEVACNGLKCREKVCQSCNSESEAAAERACAAYYIATTAIAKATSK